MSDMPSAAPAAPASAPAASSAPSSSPSPSSSSPSPTPSSAPVGGTTPAGTPDAAPVGSPAAAEAAKAAEIRKWKLKVNGQEREVDEQELTRRAQLGFSADEKFREASEMRGQAEQFFNMLMNNPKELLLHPEMAEKIGFRQLAEEYLAGELQKEMLPPEQRELNELRAYRAQQEAAAQEAATKQQTTAQQQQMQAAQARAAQEYDVTISQVLNKADLPKTPETVKRVASMLKNALTQGYELDVQTAVDMVRDTYHGDFKSLFGGLKGEQLVKFLGADVLKELRQHDLAAIKARLAGQSNPVTAPTTAVTPPAHSAGEQPSKQMRMDDWLAEARRKAGV